MKNYILACFFLLALVGCNDEGSGCGDIDCTSPAPNFYFELVDKDTSENLFANGTLNSEDVSVVDENGTVVDADFYSEDDLNLISAALGWNTSITNYTILVGSELEIDIYLAVERKTKNCCSFYEVIEFSIPDYEYEKKNPHSVTIFIDDLNL